MGGKSDKVTTTQNNDPWAPAQGDLKGVLDQARGLNARGSQYAPFSTVVPFSNQSEQALQGIEGRANAGNPLYTAGRSSLLSGLDQLNSTANGDYLNGNPHLSQMFNALSGDVSNAVNSQFSASGRTGSPAHAGVMTQQLGNLGAQIYGQDYARERQNQLSAAGQMPGYTGAFGAYQDAGYNDLNRLGQVGAAREGKAGETLQDMLNRFNFTQQAPWDNLMKYGSLAQGIGGMGGTQVGVQEQEQSLMSQLTGLLAAGAGVAKAVAPKGF